MTPWADASQPGRCPQCGAALAPGETCADRFDAHGYLCLARDCAVVASLLERSRVPNPRLRDGGRWYVADVEMAVFACLMKM